MNASSTIGSLSAEAAGADVDVDAVASASARPTSCGATGCSSEARAPDAATEADSDATTPPATPTAPTAPTAATVASLAELPAAAAVPAAFPGRTPSSAAHCAVLASIERSVS
nr:hypothetical protein [Burkholderia vietnamiensis]